MEQLTLKSIRMVLTIDGKNFPGLSSTISARTSDSGNVDSFEITASRDLTIDGKDSDGFSSSISSLVSGEGGVGGVTISTTNLNLTNGGEVSARTSDSENVGSFEIKASGNITIDGEDSSGFSSGINSSAFGKGIGRNINLSTTDLNLTNGGQVSAITRGEKNAGNISRSKSHEIMRFSADAIKFQASDRSLIVKNLIASNVDTKRFSLNKVIG